jgi:hypothetical protein
MFANLFFDHFIVTHTYIILISTYYTYILHIIYTYIGLVLNL